MAQVNKSNGVCMLCNDTPSRNEILECFSCYTHWHFYCLASQPQTLVACCFWECPDCVNARDEVMVSTADQNSVPGEELVAEIQAIKDDESNSERQEAERRQELLSGHVEEKVAEEENDDISEMFKYARDEVMVLTADQNSVPGEELVAEIKVIEDDESNSERLEAERSQELLSGHVEEKVAEEENDDITEMFKCYICLQLLKRSVTTACGHNFCLECFKRWTAQGKRTCANSTSERIFVTVPEQHFGPILAEHDPERNKGVLVGETWKNRMEVRQWGVHFPPVSGIAGQASRGAQSVVLSGGYEDDEDHGDWFLYTGSGGRDLSGNKRTNKLQSFDQSFEKCNEALKTSCKKGYPVRVVRSCKVKHSPYAPPEGLRYDGIYRVEKCWRKVGEQGFKVCRYLFVRCDNAPAPWTSDNFGDEPRFSPEVAELKYATDICQREESPSWDYDWDERCWKWKKPLPPSIPRRAATGVPTLSGRLKGRRSTLLKEFSCLLCKKVLSLPVTTPCGHNFCKGCLEGRRDGKTLRSLKNVICCPKCSNDITNFLYSPQVNRELMEVIQKLQHTEEVEESLEPNEQEDEDNKPKGPYKRKRAEASVSKPNADENQQEQKRGRGRPKGWSKAKQKEAENL